MTTWTLKRILVLVAAIAIGVFVLRQGFAGNATELIAGSANASSPHPTTSPRRSPSVTPSPRRRAKVRGVVVHVVNGSGTTGLGASTSLVLTNQGYKVNAPSTLTGPGGGNATTPATTIYYRADSLPEAQYVQRHFFPAAQVLPAPGTFPTDVQVTIVLGTDFAGVTHSP
jgi:hypothetical protein